MSGKLAISSSSFRMYFAFPSLKMVTSLLVRAGGDHLRRWSTRRCPDRTLCHRRANAWVRPSSRASTGGSAMNGLNEEIFASLAAARPVIARRRQACNQVRPHSAHGGFTQRPCSSRAVVRGPPAQPRPALPAAGFHHGGPQRMKTWDSHYPCGTVGEQVRSGETP